MGTTMDFTLHAAVVGLGATLVMDAWIAVRKRVLGIAPLDYALVGRWLGHLAGGRVRHERIAASPPVRGERVIGWSAHYLIGIAFAAALLAAWGMDWARRPALGPALIVGMATVAIPFLVMQPAMGAGIAASRTPRPAAARLQTLVTHAVFGLGLYGAGWLARLVLTAIAR